MYDNHPRDCKSQERQSKNPQKQKVQVKKRQPLMTSTLKRYDEHLSKVDNRSSQLPAP